VTFTTIEYLNDDRIRQIVRDELSKQTADCPPDKPDPTLEDELRELVGKHECLSCRVRYRDEAVPFWDVADAEGVYAGAWHRVTTGIALTVVRGIVKAMCDEQAAVGHSEFWQPNASAITDEKWTAVYKSRAQYAAKELPVIDALLTAMK
jgi:hypothetical protein